MKNAVPVTPTATPGRAYQDGVWVVSVKAGTPANTNGAHSSQVTA